MSELAQTFTKKLGPLPAWAWVGIGAGVGFLYLRRKASSSASTAGVPGATLGYGAGAQLGTGSGFGGFDLGGGGGGGGSGGGTGGSVWDGILGSDPGHPINSGGSVLTQWLGGVGPEGGGLGSAQGAPSRWMTYSQDQIDKLSGAPGPWQYLGLQGGIPTWSYVGTPQGSGTPAGVAAAVAAPVATLASTGATQPKAITGPAPLTTEGWR